MDRTDLLYTSGRLIDSCWFIDESSRKSKSLIYAIFIPRMEKLGTEVHVAKDNGILGEVLF